MSHIILDHARRYNEPANPPTPENSSYDEQAGYWRNKDTGEALVSNDGFRNSATKKADRETGEDQKGE